MRRILILIILFAMVFGGLPQYTFATMNHVGPITPVVAPESGRNFDETENEIIYNLTSIQVEYGIPAFSAVLVGADGPDNVKFSYSFGEANLEEKEFDENSLFQVGSLASLTSFMGLMHLLDQNEIDYSSQISQYLPEMLKPKFGNLTFDNILLRTTGFPATRFDSISIFERKSSSTKFLNSKAVKPIFEPGVFTLYSNIEPILAGVLIESISDRSFDEYMRQYFDFLGMENTSLKWNSGGEQTMRFNVVGGRKFQALDYYPNHPSADSLITNTKDMEKILAFLCTSPVAKKMLKKRFVNNPFSAGRSYGFTTLNYMGHEAFLVDGAAPGAYSRIIIIPAKKISAFIYYNSDSYMAREGITKELFSSFLSPFNEHKRSFPKFKPKTDLDDYQAMYYPLNNSKKTIERITEYSHRLNVSKINDGLLIGKAFYTPVAETLFYNEASQKFAEFRANENGKLSYLIIGNEVYENVGLFTIAPLETLFFLVLGLLTLILAIIIYSRWHNLFLDRVNQRPRYLILIYTVYTLLMIIIAFNAIKSINYWGIAYGPSIMQHTLRILGYFAPFAFLFILFVTIKTARDHRWDGMLAIIMRISIPFYLFFIYWLFYYNFILS